MYDGAKVDITVGVVAKVQDFRFPCEPVQLFGEFDDLADNEDGRGTQGIFLDDIEEIIDQIYIGFFDDDPDKNFAPS